MLTKALLLLASLSSAAAVWSWKDACAMSPTAAVKVLDWSMPTLIENGNRYPLAATFNVSKAITGSAKVSVSAERDPDGSGFKPFTKCFGDMGACSFGVADRPGHPSVNPLFYAAYGSGATGGVPAGLHKISQSDFFPGLSPVEVKAVHGSWRMNVSLADGGVTLGCWTVAFDFGVVPSKC